MLSTVILKVVQVVDAGRKHNLFSLHFKTLEKLTYNVIKDEKLNEEWSGITYKLVLNYPLWTSPERDWP